MKHCILIVDDEPNVRLNYRVTLETEGFEVREASDGGAALRELAGKDFDLAILDMRMPEMDGLELLESMRERNIQTPVVIITAYGDIPHAVRAMKLGAIDFLEKPLTPEVLRSTVGEILGRHAKPAPHPVSEETFDAHVQAAKRLINLRQFTRPGNRSPRRSKFGRIRRRSSISAACFSKCSRITTGRSATTARPSG